MRKEIMDYITDKGLYDDHNQDAVICIKHYDYRYKLMVVADGVGKKYGSKNAAQYIVASLKKWFLSIDNFSYSTINVKDMLIEKIDNINKYLFYNRIGQSTVVVALVTPSKTIIVNVGDSRAYTIVNQKINQLTIDDSFVYNLYLQNKISNKEYLRYSMSSNLITSSLGSDLIIKPHINIIDNNYDILLLFSDGVTDCLSDEKIRLLSNKHKKTLLSQIIYEAIYIGDNTFKEEAQKELQAKHMGCIDIIPGKDNTTGAMYLKRK